MHFGTIVLKTNITAGCCESTSWGRLLTSGIKLLLLKVAIRLDLRQVPGHASFHEVFLRNFCDPEPGFGNFPLVALRAISVWNLLCEAPDGPFTSTSQDAMQLTLQSGCLQMFVSRLIPTPSLFAVIALLSTINVAAAGSGPRMIEVSDTNQTYTGMIVAKSAGECFIVDRFGRQAQLPIAGLKSFSVVAENFRSASQSEFRRMLETELGTEYEFTTSKHYIVGGTRGHSRSYAALFEEIFNQVDSFYSLRGFRTSSPDTPLVALVLKDQEAFKKYCEGDQMPWTNGLRGYYSLRSNRVVMYDQAELFRSVQLSPEADPQPHSTVVTAAASMSDAAQFSETNSVLRLQKAAAASTVNGDTADTIIHETTHQVSFNIGIHSRTGGTPSWVLEGMATTLEAPGMRTRSSSEKSTKVNQERLEWFKSAYSQHRQPGDLAKLIASDDMFRQQTLDAYSAAWGITWFLTENPARAQLFSKYLKSLRGRDPLQEYTAQQRLKDFQTVFGDISRLEVDYVRAIESL